MVEAQAQLELAHFVEDGRNDLFGLEAAIRTAEEDGVPAARLEAARQRAKNLQTLKEQYGIGTRDVIYPTGWAADTNRRGAIVPGFTTEWRRSRASSSTHETDKPKAGANLPLQPAEVPIPTLVQGCATTTFLENETKSGNIDEMLQGLAQTADVHPRVQNVTELSHRLDKAKRSASSRVLQELDDSIHRLEEHGLARWAAKVHSLGLRDEGVLRIEAQACELASTVEAAIERRKLADVAVTLRRLVGDEVIVRYNGREAEADVKSLRGGEGSPLFVTQLADGGPAETAGVRVGDELAVVVREKLPEDLSQKTPEQALAVIHAARQAHFRCGGLALPQDTSPSVLGRVAGVRRAAFKLLQDMLGEALAECDIDQLQACMPDLYPLGC